MKKNLLSILSIIFLTTITYGQTNAPGTHPGSMPYQKYVSPQMNPQGCDNILLYSDDPVNQPDFPDVALQNLGCSYTGYYDANFSGFDAALTSGSWDLVIFANDNWTPNASTFSALLAYVQAGGKLIYHSWNTNLALETALGATLIYGYSGTQPIYRWAPGHPVFTIPNAVPDLTNFIYVAGYGIEGWHTNPISPAIALAGYTTTPATNQSALILGNDARTIYQSWMDANVGDADSDGKRDQVELYENMIQGLCLGFPSAVPISNWALIFGAVLNAVFIGIRAFFLKRA